MLRSDLRALLGHDTAGVMDADFPPSGDTRRSADRLEEAHRRGLQAAVVAIRTEMPAEDEAPPVPDDDVRASAIADGSEREPILSRNARSPSMAEAPPGSSAFNLGLLGESFALP
jgi:hypothetical protein